MLAASAVLLACVASGAAAMGPPRATHPLGPRIRRQAASAVVAAVCRTSVCHFQSL
jgi:hypothetical protein